MSKLDAQFFFKSTGPLEASPDDYILYEDERAYEFYQKPKQPLHTKYAAPIKTNYCFSNEASNLHAKYCVILLSITNNSKNTLSIKIKKPKSDQNRSQEEYLLFNNTTDGKEVHTTPKAEIIRRLLIASKDYQDLISIPFLISFFSILFGGVFANKSNYPMSILGTTMSFNAMLWTFVFYKQRALQRSIERITQNFERINDISCCILEKIDADSCFNPTRKDSNHYSLEEDEWLTLQPGDNFKDTLFLDRSQIKDIDILLKNSTLQPRLNYLFKDV
jgi:hypothetical protein